MIRKKTNWQVIVPHNMKNRPSPREISVAEIVAKHFRATIQFLDPIDDYKRKTPDLVMDGRVVEIKSPEGNSRKSTVRGQFDRATRQLVSVLIFDARNTKLTDEFLQTEISKELQRRHRIQRVIFVGKDEKIVEITKNM